MSKFADYRVHFNLGRAGRISAHSDPISVSEAEKMIEVFGFGRIESYNGDTYWHADAKGVDTNSRPLAIEWLADPIAKVYPAKAVKIQELLDESDPNG